MSGRYILVRLDQGGTAPTTARLTMSYGEPHMGKSGRRDVPLMTKTVTVKTPGGRLSTDLLHELVCAVRDACNRAYDQPELPF